MKKEIHGIVALVISILFAIAFILQVFNVIFTFHFSILHARTALAIIDSILEIISHFGWLFGYGFAAISGFVVFILQTVVKSNSKGTKIHRKIWSLLFVLSVVFNCLFAIFSLIVLGVSDIVFFSNEFEFFKGFFTRFGLDDETARVGTIILLLAILIIGICFSLVCFGSCLVFSVLNFRSVYKKNLENAPIKEEFEKSKKYQPMED